MNSHYALLIFACSILALSGCGRSDAPAASASATAAVDASGVATLELTASDSMKYNLTRFEVRAGQEVKVILTNIGTMSKAVMGHNWVLLTKGSDPKAYADAAVGAAASDYMPTSLASQVIAHTKLLGAKQTDEITFTAPAEPGDYPFLCSFPAHFLSGMTGVLVVK